MRSTDAWHRPSTRTCRGQHVSDPDDLLGEVFYRVARSADRFVGGDEDLRPWVFTIARNCVIDDQRRRARRARHRRDPVDPVSVVETPERDDELVEALALLTPEQREVVGLRFIADLSLDDVARVTNRSVGAVKAMQHRGLEQLAKQLRPSGRTGDRDG